MSRKRSQHHSTEQMVKQLRDAETMLAAGKTIAEVVQVLEVSEQTYYRWKSKYGGLKVEEAKRLKELEVENARLKKLLAEAELDKAMLWDNGYAESFNCRFRDECLAREEFSNVTEAGQVIDHWRHRYNELQPHCSLEQFQIWNSTQNHVCGASAVAISPCPRGIHELHYAGTCLYLPT